MQPVPEEDNLLDDVLSDAAPAEFREALLRETLGLAHRRRRVRYARHVSVALATVCVVLFVAWRAFPLRGPLHEQVYVLVHTRKLLPVEVVSTQPIEQTQLAPSLAAIEVVRTTPGGLHIADDKELLALVAPRPVVLVRVGPHEQELIFSNPADRDTIR